MIGREKSRHCQTWLERRSSLDENLQRKQNCSAKFTNLEENGGKIKSVFVIGAPAARWAEKVGRCLENYRRWKNTLGKLVVTVNLEAIWFEFWTKAAPMTEEIFVFCGWWFANQLDIVSETHFSCDTVDRGLWLAILSSLLCPETDRNIRIGKQGYVLYFTDFKTWCFAVSFLTAIGVSTVVLTLGKVLFLKIN